ncbi:probable ribose-5-phosphate isomerase 4, chloroplastic [Physcomitrium patens]|uniref:probable ribose-5-phosphate isomerase 4, chloroplastic n=1 Tax=Physcomitrium patens TaxID=3218 RepID=UPI000D167C40|nr:probable ribose-5-phosphate isomerase 4, chloroplastic [Physcomitrium patens]|eukprot:XP_024376806.1 probable ribose-5-phosphate isomerase 4, chloroplastic [Physcomitrella patens]
MTYFWVMLRPSFGEAGPSGGDNPLITPEGHFVLDVVFTTPITAGNLPMSCRTIRLCNSPSEVAENLETIPGVMGHGLVIDVASAVAAAGPAGTRIRTPLFQAALTSTE